MSETGIETISVQDAAAKLRDQIQSAFASLIPAEQWQKLIEAELNKFLSSTRVKDSWGNGYKDQPSLLESICVEEFKKHIQKIIAEELRKPKYNGNAYEGKVGEVINNWLTDHAQELIQATVLELAGVAAQSLVNRMRT